MKKSLWQHARDGYRKGSEGYPLPDERQWGRQDKPVVSRNFWRGVKNASIISVAFYLVAGGLGYLIYRIFFVL